MLEVSAQRLGVLFARVFEIFRVGKEQEVVPTQHGHLLRCLQIVPQALRLKFNLRQAPLPSLIRNRVHHRFAAFFLEKPVRTAKEISLAGFAFSECGDKI